MQQLAHRVVRGLGGQAQAGVGRSDEPKRAVNRLSACHNLPRFGAPFR